MTTANKNTIFHILLVRILIMQVLYYAEAKDEAAREGSPPPALLALAAPAPPDALGGLLTRRTNQRGALGANRNPLADKLLLVSAIVLLSRQDKPGLDRIPFWCTMTVMGRDVIILLGLIIIHYTCGVVKVKPHWIGKVATVLQMTVV